MLAPSAGVIVGIPPASAMPPRTSSSPPSSATAPSASGSPASATTTASRNSPSKSRPSINSSITYLPPHPPSHQGKRLYVKHLTPGFESRVTNHASPVLAVQPRPEKYVSWSNHLDAEATIVARPRPPPEKASHLPQKLNNDWRQRLEDILWAMLQRNLSGLSVHNKINGIRGRSVMWRYCTLVWSPWM